MVTCHNLKVQSFKMRVSNLRLVACLDLNMPFKRFQSPGPFSQIGIVKADRS